MLSSEEQISKDVFAEKNIPVPTPKSSAPEFNRELASKWINSEANQRLRTIKQKLFDSLTNIPFADFRNNLNLVTRNFNETNGDRPYVVLWDTKPHGSKRWVFSLTKDRLNNRPEQASYANKKPEEIIQMLQKNKSNTLVVFDDAVYTGDQLSETIYTPLWNYMHEIKYPKRINLMLCIPYSSEIFEYMARKDWDDSTIHTKLITSKIIPSVWDVITNNEQAFLRSLHSRLNKAGQGDDADDTKFQAVRYSSTTTTFDHKIPDADSVCRPLLASIGVDLKTRREPYKVKETPYYEMEKREYGKWWTDFLND